MSSSAEPTSPRLPFKETLFGRLPSELRNNIYDLVLTSPDEKKFSRVLRIIPEERVPPRATQERTIAVSNGVRYVEVQTAQYTSYGFPRDLQGVPQHIRARFPALLCTCQQVAAEATALWLETRVFGLVNYDLPHFLQDLTPTHWPFITSLEVDCWKGKSTTGIIQLVKCYNLTRVALGTEYETGREDDLAELGGVPWGLVLIRDDRQRLMPYAAGQQEYDELLKNAKAFGGGIEGGARAVRMANMG
ncbi:hypothetical protein MMC18_003667 [Xylographa bjoerkii]|nr:hypothetical protein [Xylographa bjoerkii]